MAIFPAVQIMKVEKFCSLPEHPKQRETINRAYKYNLEGKHLSKPDKMHLDVKAVRFQGKIYKLDGHTRAYLWKKGDLKTISSSLICIIYEANDEAEFFSMYDRCDSADSVEKGTDRIYSALKLCGVKNKNLFKAAAHGLTSAMREMTPDYKGEKNMVPLVKAWLPEIKALSKIPDLTTKIMPSAFIAGFLMAHRYARQNGNDTKSVVELFAKYADKESAKLEGGKYNAIYGLHELRHRADKQKLLCHVRNNNWIAAKIFKLWLNYKQFGDHTNLQTLPNGSSITGREFLSKYCNFDNYKPQ